MIETRLKSLSIASVTEYGPRSACVQLNDADFESLCGLRNRRRSGDVWNLTVVACVNEYDRECDAKQEIVSNGEQGDQCMCYVCMARNSQRDDVIVISECDVHV